MPGAQPDIAGLALRQGGAAFVPDGDFNARRRPAEIGT